MRASTDRPRRTVFAFAICCAVPLLVACPKKDPPPPDAAPPPPTVAPPPVVLVPVEEDAGQDAGVDAGPVKYTGPAVNTNVARLKQCCAQLAAQSKTSPELTAAAAQCNTLASQVAPNGNAPELGILRGLLAGKTIPPICAGF